MRVLIGLKRAVIENPFMVEAILRVVLLGIHRLLRQVRFVRDVQGYSKVVQANRLLFYDGKDAVISDQVIQP